MRLFTAIDIPEQLRSRLGNFIETLRPLAKLSWSPLENLHITTKFIGEWPEAKLTAVQTALSQVPKAGPIAIEIASIGWFPAVSSPRVFWTGVHASAALRALAEATEDALAPLGIARETRNFSPHLTLARVRESVPLQALQKTLANAPASFGAFRAEHFYLYLSRAGKYTKLAAFPLQ